MPPEDAIKVNLDSIKENLLRLEKIVEKHIEYEDAKFNKLEDRVGNIENWKIAFVAKFSVYSSIALFLGTLASQLAIWAITR